MGSAAHAGAGAGIALAALLLSAGQSRAWGPEGHMIIASFADHVLEQSDAAVHEKIVKLLEADKSNSWTKTDIVSEANWADILREKSPEARTATTAWHYVKLKGDEPNVDQACFGRPAVPTGLPASHGPQDDCAIDKVEQFARELHDPATSASERLTALQFLLNLVGDLNDPLDTIDRGDQAGRCTALLIGHAKTPVRLSSYWDGALVTEVAGKDPARGAVQIAARLKPEDIQKWASGTPEDWALESFNVAKTVVYGFPAETAPTKYAFPAVKGDKDTCGPVDIHHLDEAYETRALAAVKEQLAKAGVRLAVVLRDSLK